MQSAEQSPATPQSQPADGAVIALRQPAADMDQGGHGTAPITPARRAIPHGAVVVGLALAAGLGGAAWIWSSPAVETTDDAYVAADTTSVAPRIRGFVSQVLVRDNQPVRAGAALVRIDPEEFDARLDAARAGLADADADVAAARAALTSLRAEEGLSAATVVATRTAIRSSVADARHAEADKTRFEALVMAGAVARRDAETYRTAAVGAEQGAARAQAQLEVARNEALVTSARRPGLQAALAKAEAARLRAQAALDLAQQDHGHTLITAPIDGVVGNRQVRVGDYVQPGTRLLTLVPMQALYVTANFKETQTGAMQPGQPVSLTIDAQGSETLRGRVDSLAPGSGSTFALLPFEPGTGNFTKIVQRVPVRIRLDPGQPLLAHLRPGLSVTAKVRVAN